MSSDPERRGGEGGPRSAAGGRADGGRADGDYGIICTKHGHGQVK